MRTNLIQQLKLRLPYRKIAIRVLFWALVGCAPFSLLAQDATFSQYNLTPYYYNPAYTGSHGGYQISATYRSLWPNVPGKTIEGPLSTALAVFDAAIKSGNSFNAGIGMFAMTNVEGEGFLTTNTVGISYAQHFAKIGGRGDAMPRIQISLGFKAYINSISVNRDKLVYSDQLSLLDGITGASAADQNGVAHKVTGDADAGMLLINNFKGKDNWYNEAGFALAHILSPNESLTGARTADSRLPRKYVITYRSSASIARHKFYVGPSVLFENQGKFFELNTGVDFYVNPNPGNNVIPLCFSVMNRYCIHPDVTNTNAVILSARYKGTAGKDRRIIYNIGFAVDLPYSALAMQTKGAYELTLNVILPRKGNNNFSKCPYSLN